MTVGMSCDRYLALVRIDNLHQTADNTPFLRDLISAQASHKSQLTYLRDMAVIHATQERGLTVFQCASVDLNFSSSIVQPFLTSIAHGGDPLVRRPMLHPYTVHAPVSSDNIPESTLPIACFMCRRAH